MRPWIPLVHELYVPSHHSDESFQAAVVRGVQPHHWDFGAMPPVQGLSRDDVADVVAYVRQLQREAGIIDRRSRTLPGRSPDPEQP